MSCQIYVTLSDPTVPAATKEDSANGSDCPMDIEQQTVASPRMVARRHCDDITFSPRLKRLGIDFPLFTDEMMKQYQQHNVENFNPFVFLPALLSLYVMIAVRHGLAGFQIYGGKSFHISLLFFLCFFVSFLLLKSFPQRC